MSPVCSFLNRPSMVDFSGHLAAVFFVSGCNFRCSFCHNAALLGTPRLGLPWARIEEACARFRDQWVDAAVISGGEPTLSPELEPLIAMFRRVGWAVKLDTNGSCPDVVERCLGSVDYVAMDVKAGRSAYPALTGWTDVDAVQRTIDLLRGSARDYEFRTTVVEPFHDDNQMREIGSMIAGARRYVLQPFVPRDDLPDASLRHSSRTPHSRLIALRDFMRPFCAEVLVRGES